MSYSKIITLDDHFSTGEPTVQLVSTWGRGGRLLREATSLHKIASTHSPAVEYIKTVAPEPGKTIVLVIGLGDNETYGANRNGDGFPSQPVKGKIAADEVLTKHYQSYDKAHVFEHHVNNDPAKAIGRVKKAFWNPHMRRVEVVEDFDNVKAPHLLEKIASGEFPSKSMGCVLVGTPVQTPSGFVPIQDIKVGDSVLTHKGNWKKVTELYTRPYFGKLYSFRTCIATSRTTREHPYAVLPRECVEEEFRTGAWRRKQPENIDLNDITWVAADNVRLGDYLVTPFNTEIKETLTVDECRILGYYAAEGFLTHSHRMISSPFKNKGISFSHHQDDALTTELPALLAQHALGPNDVIQKRDAVSTVALITHITDHFLYDLCDTHVGHLAQRKCLSLELMQQPKAQQLAFLGAYLNGDGYVDKKTGDFSFSSCNRSLLTQVQQIALRCGVYGNIYTERKKPSRLCDKPATLYRLRCSRKYCSIIAPFTNKCTLRDLMGNSTGPVFVGNTVITKIKEITILELDAQVYNLEIEDDNSYVTNNHAVHNCRIKYDVCANCGNRAKTRADYCSHLKFAMNRIDPHSGIQNSALNPSPDFFDSSWVLRPADRTGFMMKKVAKEHAYEIRMGSFELGDLINDLSSKSAELGKAADIEKVMQGEPTASVSNLKPKDAQLVKKYVNECADSSEKEPDHTRAVSIMISYKPSEALESADELGLPLGLKDIIQYFLGKIAPETAGADKKTLKSANDHLGLIYSVYSKYPRFYNELVKEAGLDGTSTSNPMLLKKLAAESPTTDYLKRQVMPEAMYPGRAKTDMVSWSDPNSGQRYQTNYGAVEQTHDPLIREGLAHKTLAGGALLGTGALLGGAAFAARNTRIPKALTIGGGLVGAGLGAVGIHNLLGPTPIAGPKVVTDQGETISGWTPMTPKHAEATLANFPYIVKRANEAPTAMNPQYVDWFIDQLKFAEIHDELSPYIGPTLDLEKVAQALGTSILKRTA